MFKKEKEEIKQIVDEKSKVIGERAQFMTLMVIAGGALSVGFIAGALSTAILFNTVKNQ